MAHPVAVDPFGRSPAERWSLRSLIWFSEALAVGLFWSVCSMLSAERAAMLGARLMGFLGPKVRDRHEIIRQNLKLAFPEKQPGEIERLALRTWQAFGKVLAEYPHLKTFSQFNRETTESPRIRFGGALEALRRKDEPTVFVTAHVGNWELAALLGKEVGFPLSVAYTPEKNWRVQGMIQAKRRALGCDCIPTTSGLLPFARALSNGRSLGFVIDRRLKQGEPSTFFGRDTYMSLFPARLALKFGYDLVAVRVERLEDGSYLVTASEPVEPDPALTDNREKATQMTLRVNEIIESWIRDNPGDWFCSKRMWPKPSKLRRRAAHANP